MFFVYFLLPLLLLLLLLSFRFKKETTKITLVRYNTQSVLLD